MKLKRGIEYSELAQATNSTNDPIIYLDTKHQRKFSLGHYEFEVPLRLSEKR